MVYRGIYFRNCKPITDVELLTYEKRFGKPFPTQYILYLKTVNGGRPKPARFSFKGATSGKMHTDEVDYFYGSRSPEYSLEWALKTYIDTRRMPKDYLPIASLEGSDVLFINAVDEKVYTWFSEGEGEEPSNCSLVAECFDKLLELFHK